MSALPLPGDIPGLLRRCSPVYAFRYAGRTSGICHGATYEPDGNIGTWVHIAVGNHVDAYAVRHIDLDLTDATGRAHAAWWLAKSTAGVWRSVDGYVWTDGDRLYDEVDVPALRAIMGQEAHCRALPDGSMWRDAEALRLACLHVAGRAP